MAPRPWALTICRRLKEERPQPAGRLRAFWFDRRGEEWGWGEAVERHKNPSREKKVPQFGPFSAASVKLP